MIRSFVLVLWLLAPVSFAQSYQMALSGSYGWGAQVQISRSFSDTFDLRGSLEFAYYPDRDRFSPQTYTVGLGLDMLRDLPLELPATQFYAGGGFNVSYNIPTFVYRPFWAFRVNPILGFRLQLDDAPVFFIELIPELDLSPHFNVNAVDFTAKIRLGVSLFEF